MDSSHLSPDQLHRLRAHVERKRDYLVRLVNRLDELGFSSDDPLRRHADLAAGAMDALARASMIANASHGRHAQHDLLSRKNPNRL